MPTVSRGLVHQAEISDAVAQAAKKLNPKEVRVSGPGLEQMGRGKQPFSSVYSSLPTAATNHGWPT